MPRSGEDPGGQYAPPEIERHVKVSLHIMGHFGIHRFGVETILIQSGYSARECAAMVAYYREYYPLVGKAQ